MSAKRYNLACILGLLGLLAAIAGFNRWVNPFDYYPDFAIAGFNAVKTEFRGFEHYVKPKHLRERQPEVLIVGSSYAEIGFDPLHPALTENGALRAYNFGMAGAHWPAVFCNARYALAHARFRKIVLGIHLAAMPMIDCEREFPDLGRVSPFELLLSMAALEASVATIKHQNKPPSHTPEGLFFHTYYKMREVERIFRDSFQEARAKRAARCRKDYDKPIVSAWSPSTEELDTQGLEALLREFAARNIEIKLAVYPVHALLMEFDIQCGADIARWRRLQQVAGLIDAARRRGERVELWEFQGLNPGVTERVRNGVSRYWQDVGHFDRALGDKMLDLMFHIAPVSEEGEDPPLGVRVEAERVPELYARFLRDRERFLADNPWFHRDLEALRASP
jgi:hypothetical protein